ncbi:cell division topological specificity factor MinE [Panacagrimonas sp.]|uniref:cell division topological specificity factor MinE n=1 Tax=Panacagrimonas sp. TaxID=2480088 RepID=UPI003B52CC8A
MDWFGWFKSKNPPSANTARDRLMMVVAIQRDQDGRRTTTGDAGALSYLPQLREELLAVVRKYVPVPDSAVQVNLQRESGLEVLEMNITLPERGN